MNWGFGDDQKNMEVRDKNIFKNSMNYEFKIWTREKNQTCLCYLRAKLFLPDVKKIVSII